MRASFNESCPRTPLVKVHPSTRAYHGPRSVSAPLYASVQQTPLVCEPLYASRSIDLARERSLLREACPPKPLVGASFDAVPSTAPRVGAPLVGSRQRKRRLVLPSPSSMQPSSSGASRSAKPLLQSSTIYRASKSSGRPESSSTRGRGRQAAKAAKAPRELCRGRAAFLRLWRRWRLGGSPLVLPWRVFLRVSTIALASAR